MGEARTGKRFPLHLPITLKAGKSAKPRAATTSNVSAAGVYLSANANLEVGSRIQFAIKLPGKMMGTKKDVEIDCRGHVVRLDHAPRARRAKGKKGKAKKNEHGMACVIDSYKFRRNS